MADFVSKRWANLCDAWRKASFWQKVVIANVVYPYWLTFAVIGYFYSPPEDVKILAKENGDLFVQVTGTAWEIACHFFGKALGL